MFPVRIITVPVLALALFAMAGFQGAPYQPKPGETVVVLNVEGKGEVVIRLFTDKAPRTTAHISALAGRGFYDGQKVFRVVTEPRPFLVQFGDPGSRTKPMGDPALGSGGSGTKIAYEDTGVSNTEGTVGLSAPQGDRDGGDSQFYINLANNRFLDGSYTVFGQVVKGMDVVKRVSVGDSVPSVSVKKG